MHPFEIAEHSLVEREIKYNLDDATVFEKPVAFLKTDFMKKKPLHSFKKKIRKMIRKQVKKQVKKLRKMLFPRVLSPSL